MRNKAVASLDTESDVDHRFACNICFEQVSEPVVTQCGHLYCWSCLFLWLEPGMNPQERHYLSNSYPWRLQSSMDLSRRACPVCKTECSVMTVIPIFVREEEKKKKENHAEDDGDDGGISGDIIDHGNVVPEEDKGNQNESDEARERHDNVDYEYDIPDIHGEPSSPIQDVQQEGTRTGIRQRRNIHVMRSSEEQDGFVRHEVPNRPQPPTLSPAQRVSGSSTTNSRYRVANGRQTVSIITQITSILSRITAEQGNFNQPSPDGSHGQQPQIPPIPSLHNRRLDRDDLFATRGSDSVESVTAELLGRVLLVLGSIVILFLLVF